MTARYPGYCRGCGRTNPCRAKHSQLEQKRLDDIAREATNRW